MDAKLNLAEELLLLALNDEKGTVRLAASVGLPYGLAGALLVELVEAGLARVEGKNLTPGPSSAARDELLDEALGQIRSAARTRTIGHWVGKLGRSGGKIKAKLLARLVEKRILTREERSLLWVFPASRYPQVNPTPEYRIRERVLAAIRGMKPPDERTAALISLIWACDMIGILFERGERREAKKRAKEISQNQPIGGAVARTVKAIKAAMAASAGG